MLNDNQKFDILSANGLLQGGFGDQKCVQQILGRAVWGWIGISGEEMPIAVVGECDGLLNPIDGRIQ
jgi:hypothetical protein